VGVLAETVERLLAIHGQRYITAKPTQSDLEQSASGGIVVHNQGPSPSEFHRWRPPWCEIQAVKDFSG